MSESSQNECCNGPTENLSANTPVDSQDVGLPPYNQTKVSNFKWSDRDRSEVEDEINLIYSEIVHWRRKIFKIPSGKHGKAFVSEVARLFQLYADASSMEAISITAAMIVPALILQKPFRTSKTKDHIMQH